MSRIPPRLVNAYISGLPIRATNCLLRPSAQLLRPIAAPSASRHHQRTLTSSTPLREDEDDKPPIRRTVARRWAAVSEPVIPLRKVIHDKHDEIGIARAKNVGKEAATAAKAEEEAIKAEREVVQREKAAVKAHLELLQETGSKEPLGHWSPTFLLTPEAAQAAAEAKLDAAIAELEAARAAAKVAAIAASEAGVEAAILELETAKAEKEKAKEKAKAAAKAAVKAEKEAAEAHEKLLKKNGSQETLKDWECTIGIEIHAQLNTAKKLFSSSRNVTGEGRGPNTELSFFDLALPGSQPQFQKETLIPALRAALALDCDINKESGWDRKHYFHWDQPSGYQITQFFKPFAQNGSITLYPHDGIAPQDIESAKKTKNQGVKVNIKQIQMEQDTAGTITKGEKHYINFNRVGKPLIEIITGPDIHYPSTAAALVRKIQTILNSVDACTLGMEQGGLRADVNVSVRRRGELGTAPEYNGVSGLGTRTEIKNLSSFKSIRDAIIVERNRQVEVLESGGVVEGETRGFNIGDTHTTRLRGKEGEVDYRYMPDPDLPPLIIGQDLIEHLRETMGVLPDEQLEELTRGFGLSIKDALSLVSLDDGYRAEYFYSVLDELAKKFAEPNPQGPPEGSSVIEEWKRMGWTEWYQARLARSEPWFSFSASPSNSEIVKKPEFQRDAEWDKKFGPKVANWVLHELGGLTSRLGEDGEAMDGVLFDQSYRGRCMVRPMEVAELIRLLEVGRITRKTGKYVLGELYRMGVEIFEEKKEEGLKIDWTKALPAAVEVIDKEELWFKRMTAEEYEVLARETEEERLWKDILGENRKRAEGKIQYWIGMMMRVAGDRCDAKEARRVIDGLVEEKRWESGKFEVDKERREVEGLRKKLVEMGRVVNRRVAELEREEKDEEEGEEEEK